MTVTLASLSQQTGLAVLDHLELQVTIPVIDGIQAQGDLLVIPHHLVAVAVMVDEYSAEWNEVPATGLELLRSANGGNPHTLVADPRTCQWTSWVRDTMGLALGVFQTSGPAYLLHPEHGATGLVPGSYVVRRQRELDHRVDLRTGWSTRGGGSAVRLVAD
jgi:hypothetical protein